MRFVIAFRAFFAVLFSRDRAMEVKQLLLLPPVSPVDPKKLPAPTSAAEQKQKDGPVSQSTSQPTGQSVAAATKPASPKSNRSDAITLLATLQREARFVDLVQESLDQYSDAQIGAAARDVLRDTKKCLNQLLAIEPLAKEGEGARVRLPSNPSPVHWKLLGGVKDSGTIAHAGWKASQISMPTWTGSAEDQGVIAPVEVE